MAYAVTSRDELLLALNEAAQIEHCLMVQYLFAAFSMKQSEDEGLTWEQAELVNGWKADILRVARDEMGHLGTVLNMINAVGGVPDLQHPNFPLASPKWFPFPFELTRFSADTVRRFVRFEQPEPMALQHVGIPHQPEFDYVGELYRQIKAGFQLLDAKDPNLFVGNPSIQDDASWATLRFVPRPIRNLGDATSAVDAIVEQGEGTPDGSDPLAHFATFSRIAKELDQAIAADPAFVPSRAVVTSPALVVHPEAGTVVLISEQSMEGRCCSIFSELYAVLLLTLYAYYSFDPALGQSRENIQRIAKGVMGGILRPLGELITTLPVTQLTDGSTCGPTFEAIGKLQLPPTSPAKWTVLRERVDNLLATISDTLNQPNVPGRLPSILGNVAPIRDIIVTLETGK